MRSSEAQSSLYQFTEYKTVDYETSKIEKNEPKRYRSLTKESNTCFIHKKLYYALLLPNFFYGIV